ncbi:hypothetical protein [Nitrospirillum sp. BR 11163]|uniref:hypothetical protein n=1 Tax=Nitrospirillum sp. BR 11163 TaxID=3104323 RepID=UPI002AFF5224|nr:hypothetical protein [Nitrospirillum sp. BR 11163]MEA1677640.1 hypothetical protein [Nitrospirillum sp. BR 11163]
MIRIWAKMWTGKEPILKDFRYSAMKFGMNPDLKALAWTAPGEKVHGDHHSADHTKRGPKSGSLPLR